MDVPFCDVIGCSARAVWILQVREGDHTEEYLCKRHWNELRLRNPDYSSRYAPLNARQASGATPPSAPVDAVPLADEDIARAGLLEGYAVVRKVVDPSETANHDKS